MDQKVQKVSEQQLVGYSEGDGLINDLSPSHTTFRDWRYLTQAWSMWMQCSWEVKGCLI